MPSNAGHGRSDFVERFGLLVEERRKRNAEVEKIVSAQQLDVIRLSFADQHGILRGKTIMASDLRSAFNSGVSMTTTLLAKDTSHKTIYPIWNDGGGFGLEEMTGGGDFLMVPDPSTFHTLPWANGTGWLQCDIYFSDGNPVQFCTRNKLRQSIAELESIGYKLVVGLEIEFHLFRLRDTTLRPEEAGQPGKPPQVDLLAHGFQYLTEIRADQHESIMEIIRRNLLALELPLRTTEVEFGPSQAEVTFHPMEALEAADTMVFFRNAVKQICRREGYHATFMCRPHLPNLFSSGWHLHQSLEEIKTGMNAFVPDENDDLSLLGLNYVAGVLKHACAGSVFTTPTVNGYKRFKPFSLAPDRAVWSRDNRGAMLRAIGGTGDKCTRVENRIGEPAANPYLYIASQIVAGMNGIENKLDPGPPSHEPYQAESPTLPQSLMEAVSALREDSLFSTKFGEEFVNYIIKLKEGEIARFLSESNDWEQREYFDIF